MASVFQQEDGYDFFGWVNRGEYDVVANDELDSSLTLFADDCGYCLCGFRFTFRYGSGSSWQIECSRAKV